MSIPPLVCSTPPPPDQCEDDRDTEDFDIQYNLSQDEEDESKDYNYGTYSDYLYSTSTSTSIQDKWSADITKKAECSLPNNLIKENIDSITVLPENYSSSVDKVGFEDTAIEDLNLKLEDQNDSASSTSKYDTEPSEIVSSDKESDTTMHIVPVIDKVQDVEVIVTQDFTETGGTDVDIKTFEERIKPYQEDIVNEDDIQEAFDIDKVIGDVCLNNATITRNEFETEDSLKDVPLLNNPSDQKNKNIFEYKAEQKGASILGQKNDDVDDFGDFDDFQFISSDTNPATTIEYCDNPWDKDKEISKDCEFGDFTANFDAEENNSQMTTHNLDIDNEDKGEEFLYADIDDFGDFNDFKSSSNDHTGDIELSQDNQKETSQSVQVLSMQNSSESEAQIIESINGVFSSIFLSEISEHESPFESTLESSLNETWGYLVDTDVRQPYIVNWNNSLGQKNLLKALCIDARNILFGPKWSSGMPKYAANLTVAPLQPQKPFSPSVTSEEQNIEKNINKETGSWTDPFTSDGQEYTYAEALLLDLEHLMATLDQMAHKHSSFKISDLLTHACNSEGGSTAATRPTNLDVFTNVATPSIEKIYSSTISVQPIRQINLPDTHIFTPTDSETPRSKTIHYDHGSTVLVPQPPVENIQTDDALSKPKNEAPINNSENDEDYWEFQDFKGSVSNKNTSTENPTLNRLNEGDVNNSTLPIVTNYQSQILQPIKVEPIMPTLNWPAPGEVKETFDDFSEFVSNTQWNENTNMAKQLSSEVNCKNNDDVTTKNDAVVDDFETFQSAPNLKSSLSHQTDCTYQTTANVINQNFENFDQFSDSKKSNHSIHSKTDSVNTLQQKENFVSLKPSNSPTTKNSHVKTSPVLGLGSHSNTLLQPSIAGTSSSQRNQQKTGQILQPLTLESYSQINWPNPGIDLQDLSRFNPVESLHSLKTDVSSGGSKMGSPAHNDTNSTRNNEVSDEDIWGDFVSSKPKQQQPQAKKLPVFADDDEWTDFVSSPSVKPQNGLNTISFNVHTNLSMQKTSAQGKFSTKNNQILDIPPLNYLTPKSSNRGMYNDKHFQNL